MDYNITLRYPDQDNVISIPEEAVIVGVWQNPNAPVGVVYLTPVVGAKNEEDED